MKRCLVLAVALSACTDGKDDAPTPCVPDLAFTDANNYSFTSDFQIGEITVAPETELQVDWSALATDIRGRSVDPTSVTQLLAVRFQLTQAEVLTKIDENSLAAADADLQYIFTNPGVSETPISAFNIIGNPLDLTELKDDADTTWLISVVNFSPTGSLDFLMNTFVVPTTGEGNTDVVITDASANLDFDVDLATAAPLVAATTGATVLDWSGATTDAYGRPLDLNLVNNLVIGHVAESDITKVEEIFLRLYDEADQVYDLDVNALTNADLSQAVSRQDGSNFTGFTTDGTWVVGIECTRQECTNPAPILLAVVEVCE